MVLRRVGTLIILSNYLNYMNWKLHILCTAFYFHNLHWDLFLSCFLVLLRPVLIVANVYNGLMFRVINFKLPFQETNIKKQAEITLKTLQIKINCYIAVFSPASQSGSSRSVPTGPMSPNSQVTPLKHSTSYKSVSKPVFIEHVSYFTLLLRLNFDISQTSFHFSHS